jgi:DNA-binding PadR family transcriptional regulator
MGRVFKRGELKQAVLVVLGSIGESHGYAIMGELKTRVGGGWKPSPGAIYPALLALVEQGLVAADDQDGTRMYSLTDLGVTEARSVAMKGRWAALSARAEQGVARVTVGSLLDEFAVTSELRRRLPTAEDRLRIEAILARAATEIEELLNEGEDDG